MVITPLGNNSWRLEIKPKTTRSAALLSGEAGKTLAHIAYTVDDKLKQGVYDITVSSILFQTPGGDDIVEPAITVPVTLSRTATGKKAIEAFPSSAYSHDGIIHIRSERPQQLAIYSISGVKLYESLVPAGTTAIDGFHVTKGVYIVAFSDNERRKVLVY